MKRSLPALATVFVFLFVCELGAQTGPTFTVTTTSEHDDGSCTTSDCTLIEALKAANASADANTINFAPGVTGTISNTPRLLGSIFPVRLRSLGPGRAC